MTRLFAGTPWDQPPRCDRCQALLAECQCPPAPHVYAPPETQTAKVTQEKRKGQRTVTVIRGLNPQETDFTELLAALKSACGAGGTFHHDSVEIQGNQVEKVRTLLAARGYRVR
jgi:translation initiation factor 1